MNQIVYTVLLFNLELTFQKMILNNFDTLFDYDSYLDTENNNLRQRFLNRKKQNYEQDMKIKLIDKIISNKSLFVMDILHSLDSNGINLKNKMETAFKNVLNMNGSKFIFKRDFFWRTWRVVENESGNNTIICYKCQGFINENCSKCRSGGYWVIEEKPQKCPYEILTLKTEMDVCVVNNSQYYESYDDCPSVITMRDLKIACGESIETLWRITKTYNVPERSTVVICQGRENCEIKTLYSIFNDSIVFRIINSTNVVFYSRAMKSGNRNYVCRNNCGIFNPETKEITKRDGPLIYDLLKNIKNKRDSKHINPKHQNKTKNVFAWSGKKVNLVKNGLHYKEHTQNEYENFQTIDPSKVNIELITKSPCKKLQEKYFNYEDISDYDNL